MAESKSTLPTTPPGIPEAPSYYPVDTGSFYRPDSLAFQPMSEEAMLGQWGRFMEAQSQWAPIIAQQNIDAQGKAIQQLSPYLTQAAVAQQQALMQGGFAEQMRQMPIQAQTQYGLDAQYMPQYAQQFNSVLGQTNPQFMPNYNAMGARVGEGLAAGYDLGAGLTNELEQSIRAGQTARGNWLGPAPTAQEAFGKGQASINLYNQRLAQAQGFLNGKQPTDMWGALQMARPNTAVNQPIYPQNSAGSYSPTQNYIDSGLGATAFQTAQGAQSNYNSTLAQAQSNYNSNQVATANAMNSGIFAGYDAQTTQYQMGWDQYLLGQGVQNGMYQTPSVGGSGAGMGAMVGGIASGVGAAAAAAVSALCWLARRAIPHRWKEWREYLLTSAPQELRDQYIFNARRLAVTLPDSEIRSIAGQMERILG